MGISVYSKSIRVSFCFFVLSYSDFLILAYILSYYYPLDVCLLFEDK